MIYNQKGKAVTENGLEGHNKRVNCIIESNGYMWSCSNDKTIMVWDQEGRSIRILQGHTGPIYTIALIGAHVWSGSWDRRIILWDAEVSSHSSPTPQLTLPSFSTNNSLKNSSLTRMLCAPLLRSKRTTTFGLDPLTKVSGCGRRRLSVKAVNNVFLRWSAFPCPIYLCLHRAFLSSSFPPCLIKQRD